jgi:hypothetical protein
MADGQYTSRTITQCQPCPSRQTSTRQNSNSSSRASYRVSARRWTRHCDPRSEFTITGCTACQASTAEVMSLTLQS